MAKKSTQRVYFIGCGVLGPDISHIAAKLNMTIEKKLLPGGLHSQPGELRQRLQKAIDEADQDETCCRIIVGYGLCGRGTVGIKAPAVPLVIPKVHDCIALFLGSDRAYQEEFARYPGTYYISAGWYLEKEKPEEGRQKQVWVGSQSMGCNEITEKYGKKQGKDIIDFLTTWQKNYQRAAYIDTGVNKGKKYAERAREMAREYSWEYQSIKGDLSLMTRMLTAVDSDDQILVVPSGYVTIYSAVENALAAAPPAEANQTLDSSPRYLVFDEEADRNLSIQYGLGIDAGGTYTDAAIYDFNSRVLAGKNKALTTKWDFSIGIDQALAGLDREILDKVELVSVSTTLATNAIVEGQGQKAGLLFMTPTPDVLDNLIPHTPKVLVSGRMSISGQELQPVDPDEIRRSARQMMKQNGVTAFAVSGFAGAVNPVHELEVKQILQEETGLVVSCGHELSDLLNFVVRAQTALLNARIIPRMIKFFQELDHVLAKSGIKAPLMVVKGDGTLMSATMARQRPVETILSGPAASVAGARLLSGLNEAMVVDIGGTTTDTAELAEGVVEVCEEGARVGGIDTHVKALNMRTVGLGGDSLVCWHREELCLGPRRVAPIAWADTQSPQGVDKALRFMESLLETNPETVFPQIILVAMRGEFPFEPTPEEAKLYRILLERPHALDELAKPMDLFSARLLSTQRLEECGLIQRCGLTPTDILHVRGSFRKWAPEAARRMAGIVAAFARSSPENLLEVVLGRFEKDLAKELLKKQLSRDVKVDADQEGGLAGHLLDCILSGGKRRYSISARLAHPIIGIGAPAHYFLPNAGRQLNAEVVIPEDADVANALGAITSHVLIRQKVSIKPDHLGRFVVENIAGGRQFAQIEKAEAWAIEQLKESVQKMGRTAGTSHQTVEMEIRDRIVNSADGTALFLDRTVQATLSGSPDLAFVD
ncbi:MAG: DUF1638 domain-containing protein [Desulfohalobiaceae bacterium]|nr:DUF1638 domain-containing protein [Desulfohalobiaceae bacterium]